MIQRQLPDEQRPTKGAMLGTTEYATDGASADGVARITAAGAAEGAADGTTEGATLAASEGATDGASPESLPLVPRKVPRMERSHVWSNAWGHGGSNRWCLSRWRHQNHYRWGRGRRHG